MKKILINLEYIYDRTYLDCNIFASAFFSIQVITDVLKQLGNAILPSYVVYILLQQYNTVEKIKGVIIYILLLVLFNIINTYATNIMQNIYFNCKLIMGEDLQKNLIKKNYDFIESKECQEGIAAAQKVSFYGSNVGVYPILEKIPVIISSCINIVICTIIINYYINIYVAIALILIALSCSLFYTRLSEKDFEYEKKIEPIYTKFRYLCNAVFDKKSIKDIKLFQMEEVFNEEFDSIRKNYMGISYKSVFWHFVSNYLCKVLGYVRDLIILIYLAKSIILGNMEISTLVLYIGISSTITLNSNVMFKYFQEVLKNINIIERYRTFMDKGKEEKYMEIVNLPHKPTIELVNVSYKYPGSNEYVFKNLNLTIEYGEKLAIVGNNGSGKTTLIKLICGLYKPSEGEIYIGGVNTKLIRTDKMFGIFATLFQDSTALAFSIAENISCSEIDKIDYENMKECINKAELYDVINKQPYGENTYISTELIDEGVELSGGEKQKMLLARALYKKGKILILDEPVAAFDAIAEEKLYLKYKDIVGKKTSIFVTHRLNSVVFCDRIIVINEGTIIETGTHDELLNNNGIYASMYKMQSKYYVD